MARYEQESRDEAYRIYVSDVLRQQSYELAALCRARDFDVPRYMELMENIYEGKNTVEQEEDDRSCKEIVSSLWGRMKIGKKK